jgi:type VI secretion system secreted protein Hcp
MDQFGFGRVLRRGLLLFACCIAMPASGDDIYFAVEGSQQGKIAGELSKGTPEGMMRALGFSYRVDSPRDPATGLASGKNRHEPVQVTREPGRGSPQLLHAMVTMEPLKVVRFDFYAPRIINGARVMSLYQTVKLTNATLIGFEHTAAPATDLSSGALRSLEKLEFVYQKIELIDVERNVSAQDTWISQF